MLCTQAKSTYSHYPHGPWPCSSVSLPIVSMISCWCRNPRICAAKRDFPVLSKVDNPRCDDDQARISLTNWKRWGINWLRQSTCMVITYMHAHDMDTNICTANIVLLFRFNSAYSSGSLLLVPTLGTFIVGFGYQKSACCPRLLQLDKTFRDWGNNACIKYIVPFH